MLQPRRVLEDEGPNGNVVAILEEDARTLVFYLHGTPASAFGVRAVWVANLRPAPEAPDREALQEGRAPMLERAACASAEAGALPLKHELLVSWWPSGEGAALLWNDEVIAMLPPGHGEEGRPGFAKGCIAATPFVAPLDSEAGARALTELEEAARFWDAWGEGSWPTLQQRLLASYEAALGEHLRYFAADAGKWPPRFVAAFEPAAGGRALLTGGMCIRPQPRIEREHPEPAAARRIELGLWLHEALVPEEKKLVAWLSGQSELPWARTTWLGEGHTMPCSALPAPFSHLLFTATPGGAELPQAGAFFGDRIKLLWGVPITAAERELAVREGSFAVLERLRRAGAGLPAGARAEVAT